MTTMKLPSRQARELIELVEPLGWEFAGRTGGCHILLIHRQSGRKFVASSTPSDWRTMKNAVSTMRRIAREEAART